jgi:hypothetical protein
VRWRNFPFGKLYLSTLNAIHPDSTKLRSKKMVSILGCGPTMPGWMVIPMLCEEMVHDHPMAVLSIGLSAALAIYHSFRG